MVLLLSSLALLTGVFGAIELSPLPKLAHAYDGAPLAITEWLCAGPFYTRSELDSFAAPLLAHSSGTREEPAWDMERITTDVPAGSAPIRRLARKQMIDFYTSYQLSKGGGAPQPGFWLQARISAKAEAPAILLLGSDGILSVWLNGREVARRAPRRVPGEQPYHQACAIRLQPGDNLLLVEVEQVAASCGLIAEILPSREEAIRELLARNGSFLKSFRVETGGQPRVEIAGWPPAVLGAVRVRLLDEQGRVVAQCDPTAETATLPLPPALPAGPYNVAVSIGGIELPEAIVLGDARKVATALADRVPRAGLPEASAINFKTLTRRIDILFREENRKPADREWQRKVAYTIGALQTALAGAESGQDPWPHEPGLHLRGFRSNIDGQVRHYRLFVPASYQREAPLPVAIILATNFSGSRPFIESSFVAHQLDAEAICRIAEKLGLAVLWPGYPAKPNGNPCEYTHFDECLATVCADYNIDKERLYLLGICQGSSTALMFAKHWPDRFAALALIDPLVSRDRNLPQDEGMFTRFPAYRRYIADMSPFGGLNTIAHLPIQVCHDDGAIGHGSLPEALDAMEHLCAAGARPRFDQLPLSFGHMYAWEQMLGSCAGHSRLRRDSPRPAPAAPATVGPVVNVFPDGFIVVEGTSGNREERDAIKRMVGQFQQSWSRLYYGRCRVMKDVDVTADLEHKLNLVLVGNEQTNSLWAKYAPSFDLRLEKDEVAVGGARHRIKNGAVQAVFGHPAIPGRKILLIGGSDLRYTRFGQIDLSVNGWFDYAIWESLELPQLPRLVVAETRAEPSH